MENQNETQKNPQYKYASTREKLCFGIGAIGKDAICNLVGAFLMLYFTDTLYLAPAWSIPYKHWQFHRISDRPPPWSWCWKLLPYLQEG